MYPSYNQLLSRLLTVNMHSGIKLGLANCQRLDTAQGIPSQAFPAVHVAGTNGKGSVAAKIAAALQATGLRVGLYTSPHIASFRERIRINGLMIPEDDVRKLLYYLFAITDSQKIPATFFELTTLMALTYFADEHIDIAVIETGLGGRLDATNIVRTTLAVITSISLEHTEILGNSLEAITYEKAGIIKPGRPVVIGPRVPADVVREIATKHRSHVIQVEGRFTDFHAENDAIAKKALEVLDVPPAAIAQGLKALPHCRLQIFLPRQLPKPIADQPPAAVILDVAHNPDGLAHLLQSVRQRFPGNALRFVLGISQNKDLPACLKVIKDAAVHFHLVEATNGRAAPKEVLKAAMLALGIPDAMISCEDNMAAALGNACLAAGNHNEVIIVCGTFFIMAAARHFLGIDEPTDPNDMNEHLTTVSK